MASSALIDDLKRHEGFRRFPYKDTEGIWTVGYGWNLEANPPATGHDTMHIFRFGVTEDEAELDLQRRAADAQAECARVFAFWPHLDRVRRDVLANMCFNMGLSRLLDFRRTLAHIEAGAYESAAREMLDSRWATQVKGRATELAARMRTGKR